MNGTLLLARRDVASLLTLDECITAVQQAFRLQGEGQAPPPGILGMHVDGGGFHIKAAAMCSPAAPGRDGKRAYFAAKLNGNFTQNRTRFGLPTIQGVIALCDATNGRPLALMDSIEITIQRTGAATAVAARYLARADSHVVTICGCGNQGRVQLAALRRVLPIQQVFAFDQDPAQAQDFVEWVEQAFRPALEAAENPTALAAEVATDLASSIARSDVVITCTPSKRFFLRRDHVRPGTFIAAVGADNPEKQELDPTLLKGNRLVTDITEQCAAIGDLHHAIEQGVATRADVYAELGELAAGRKPGRTSDSEITIFDSTGAALQDVAAAIVVYEKALRSGVGATLDFAA